MGVRPGYSHVGVVQVGADNIAAWRSRGCLPIPVEVTAALFEIRLRDPFFRNGVPSDDKLESDEMLALLYSMAIIRLVNGFMESPHKETGRSISDLAETVGVPRILVDIRHESSHRGIPSLRLLHLAAIKAFDWLKCNYWDSQTSAIPDVRLELSSVLHDTAQFLKGKDSENAKSGSKRKRSQKHILNAIRYVRRLYYTCPSEAVSVLLEFFQLDAPEISENSDVHQAGSLDANHSSDVQIQNQISNGDMKTIITKLSEKEPRVLLGLLKSVIEMIEARNDLEHKGGSYACLPAESSTMKNLCSLVLWIVTSIKELRDSGHIGLVQEIGVLSSDKNAVPRFCLAKLLQKFLSLPVIGERCIADAALLLIEMAGNNSVKEKLRKLTLLSLRRSPKDCTLLESRILSNGQESVESATQKLEAFKLQLRKPDNVNLAENGTQGTLNTSMPEKRNGWSIAKSWTPCPLGMIPCSYSSTAVLPVLDVIDDELKHDTAEHGDFEPDGEIEIFDCYAHPEQHLDGEGILEMPRSPPEHGISDMPELTSGLRGTLLVGGVWKKVTEEELLSIKSSMKILL
uniref:Pre-rRNA-processing protein las1 n=1 Tax=Aegilops tauschii TaxID=37682 RepID=M8C6B8_AEGTA